MKVKVKKLRNTSIIPNVASEYAVAVDLHSNFDVHDKIKVHNGEVIYKTSKVDAISSVVLYPGGRALIPTGIAVSIPIGYEMVVRPRSGLALKFGISIVNSPGTIDSDYRGEIGVILINHGLSNFEIFEGERIAQLALRKSETIEWNVVDELDNTERGEGGFGSTGK